ncbi:MAG: hypothetical protein II007_00010 [Gammaproteobacteria bacterium]|nr:hypothetical protein [Gammaproteobacteria bacterium]
MKPLISISMVAIALATCSVYIVNVKDPEIKVAAVYDMAACDGCNLMRAIASTDAKLIDTYLTPRGALAEQAANLAIENTTAGACLSGQIYRFNPLAGYIESYDYRFEVTGLLDMADCAANAQTNNENALCLLDHSPEISDPSKLGCEMPSIAQLEHLLRKGVWIDGRELHDDHSLTLCTITGRVQEADQQHDVTIDFGGVVYFKDGRILACQEKCCEGGFELCTLDAGTEN